MGKATHAKIPANCEAKLVKSSSSSYRNACTNPAGIKSGDSPYKNQVHHIVCENAILDIKPSGDKSGEKTKYIMDCLCATKWDINDAVNLIALPMKSAYRKSYGKNPQNAVCHNVDHGGPNGYTEECKLWLHKRIWNSLIDKRKGHDWNTQQIKDQLKACKDHFTTQLQSRAMRPGPGLRGTEYAYVHRVKRGDQAALKNWHYAFSMAQFPGDRLPPKDPSKFIGKLVALIR